MNVLTIMGGPRKGYGSILMEKFEYELKLLQDVDFEYLYLKDVNLESCRGCLNCFFKGEDKCSFRSDDRNKIFEKMDQADGVIFMAPAYALHIPALMKNFFDRFSYIFHRPYFFGKIAIGVCNEGIAGAKKITKYFKEVASSWGFNYVDHLEINTMPYEGTEKKIEEKIQKTCKKFIEALNGPRYQKPRLGDVLGFKIRKLLHNIAHDETNADVKYWSEQGWLDEGVKYYYDVRIGIGKRIIAWLINAALKPKFRKMFGEDPNEVYTKYLKLESLNFGLA
ncbi:MAG: flavodoxin family protein [Promethearchaeota archaeon]|nr:MAG: flavodoxin family protein [Candidatus Lokiarchaeota archaeon]